MTQVTTDQLFRLDSVMGSNYKDYWINSDLTQVYSTKRPGVVYAMTKTGTGSCRGQYWSLSNGGRFGNFIIRVADLATRVRNSMEFKQWHASRATSKQVVSGGKGFIVGSVYTDGRMSFSSSPKVHLTEASARAECERLAAANRGTRYTYLEIKGSAVFGGIVWN